MVVVVVMVEVVVVVAVAAAVATAIAIAVAAVIIVVIEVIVVVIVVVVCVWYIFKIGNDCSFHSTRAVHKAFTVLPYMLVLPYGRIDHWYFPPFCAYIACPQLLVWTGHCCYCHDLTEINFSRTPLHPLDSKRLRFAGWLWKFGRKMCCIVWQFLVKTKKYVKTKLYFYLDLILQMNIIVAPPAELNGEDTWQLLANGYNRLIISLCARKAIHCQRQ